MIQYIKRKDLDELKYNTCIENSSQSRIFAFSWYLDIVTDNWDVLVLDDYKAVMPIPWKQKYFIKYITQPYFCQQLGVFSVEKGKGFEEKFIKNIPKKFVKISLQFNSENRFTSLKMIEKVNYILPLKQDYLELFLGFNNNRKRDFKKGLSSLLSLDKNISTKEFFEFYLVNDKHYNQHKSIKNTLYNILQLSNGSLKLYGIRKKGSLIACVLLLIDKKRVTYLVPVSNNVGKENGAATFLVVEVIKQFQNLNYILDFEGSMIKGVASFYKSFGASLEEYNLFKYSKFLFLKN